MSSLTDNSRQDATDIIRDLGRQGGAIKTQVFQLDLGGNSDNPELLITAGQQLKALSVPVVLASDQGPLATLSAPAATNFGQSVSQTDATTATLASIPSTPSGYRIDGLIGTGTGDGYFVIQVNATTVLSGRTRASLPTLSLMLPKGIPVTAGSSVTLKVTNESGSTANFDGTLLGS